jgi:hypothetical protein
VWRVLTDFGHYPAWNPFVVSVAGAATARGWPSAAAVGGAHLALPSAHRPLLGGARAVLARAAGRSAWLLDRQHCFQLQPDGPGRTRFLQRGEFRGLLAPLLPASVLEAAGRPRGHERGAEGPGGARAPPAARADPAMS